MWLEPRSPKFKILILFQFIMRVPLYPQAICWEYFCGLNVTTDLQKNE
jgi:hypothetical protein